MPQMDGYELCRRIKADPQLKTIPVVMLTQLREPEDILKGLECGADNFLVKPYEDSQLISRLCILRLQKWTQSGHEDAAELSIAFAGKVHKISTPRAQILNLLFAAFEDTIRKQQELDWLKDELKRTQYSNEALRELVPVCLACKTPRTDAAYQQELERYVQEHAGAQATSGLCPRCAEQQR